MRVTLFGHIDAVRDQYRGGLGRHIRRCLASSTGLLWRTRHEAHQWQPNLRSAALWKPHHRDGLAAERRLPEIPSGTPRGRPIPGHVTAFAWPGQRASRDGPGWRADVTGFIRSFHVPWMAYNGQSGHGFVHGCAMGQRRLDDTRLPADKSIPLHEQCLHR